MDSVLSFIVITIRDEDRLNAVSWLMSVTFLLSLLLIIFKSLFTTIFFKNKISGVAECYYIRGLLVFRMLWYACLLCVLLHYWINEGLSWEDFFLLTFRISIFEVISEILFYYSALIIYNYNFILLCIFTIEPLIQILGSYYELRVIRIVFLLGMFVHIKKSFNQQVFGNWSIVLNIGMLLPIISAGLSLIMKLI